MATNQVKSLPGLCLLFALALVSVSCKVDGFPGFEPAPSISQTPAALAAAVSLSPQNMDRIEPLYQFPVKNPIHKLVWSPDSRLLAVETAKWPDVPLGEPLRTNALYLWNLADGKGQPLYSDIQLAPSQSSSVAFSADGQTLAYQEFVTTHLVDVAQNRETQVITNTHTADAAAAVGFPVPFSPKFPGGNRDSFSPDGRLVVTSRWGCNGPDNPKLEMFDAASGNKLRDFEGCYPYTFSHDSKRIATLYWNKQVPHEASVLVSDVESGKVLQRFEGNVYSGKPVIFAPGDALIAGYSAQGGTTYLWETDSGKQVKLARGSAKPTDIAFSPDGRFLAIGTHNGFVQIWGVKD